MGEINMPVKKKKAKKAVKKPVLLDVKLTKQQKTAVEYLKYDMDELDNKPRRLFESLRKFANAFLEDEEHRNDVLDSIDEWEDHYYRFLNIPDMMKDIADASKNTKRELGSRKETKWMSDENRSNYCDGLDEGCDEMTKKAIAILVDFNN